MTLSDDMNDDGTVTRVKRSVTLFLNPRSERLALQDHSEERMPLRVKGSDAPYSLFQWPALLK